MGALIGGLIEGPRLGWGSGVIVGLFALSAVSLLGLLAYEPRRVDPLMELRFFHSVPFTGSILIAVCAFVAFGSFLFLTSLYLQESRGLSAFNAGLCTLPLAVGSALASPLSGHAVAAWGTRPALLMSGCCFIVSAMMLTPLTQTTPLPFLLLAYSIFGIGFGSVNAPISHTAISGMPREQAGVAAAINSASRQIGLAVGVAVAGICWGRCVDANHFTILTHHLGGPTKEGIRMSEGFPLNQDDVLKIVRRGKELGMTYSDFAEALQIPVKNLHSFVLRHGTLEECGIWNARKTG